MANSAFGVEQLVESLPIRLTDALLIAYLVGFNGQSYFAKKFKEKYALTPSQWRKQE